MAGRLETGLLNEDMHRLKLLNNQFYLVPNGQGQTAAAALGHRVSSVEVDRLRNGGDGNESRL
jgi:hypothetical protein